MDTREAREGKPSRLPSQTPDKLQALRKINLGKLCLVPTTVLIALFSAAESDFLQALKAEQKEEEKEGEEETGRKSLGIKNPWNFLLNVQAQHSRAGWLFLFIPC